MVYVQEKNLMRLDIESTLNGLALDAAAYFKEAAAVAIKRDDIPFGPPFYFDGDYYWNQLPCNMQKTASDLIHRVLESCAKLADLAKGSTLTGPEDLQDVKLAAKRMRALLRLRGYHYSNAEIIHDEGSAIGVRPANQTERWGVAPEEAELQFNKEIQNVFPVLKLIEVSPETVRPSEYPKEHGIKYVAGTAFIMMWMDLGNPELADVLDCVKEVFKSFGIRATRADDIEHEEQITQRILSEIKCSEFLFADLTGTRPNVYYEIGFAHALGKRVILFRKSGTSVHFDLAGYNCPEYENLRDLRGKLERRLISITNKKPNLDPTW